MDSNTGEVVAAFHPRQAVWVRMSAESSRGHGPALRMRLLDDLHPDVTRAMSQLSAEDAGLAAEGKLGGSEGIKDELSRMQLGPSTKERPGNNALDKPPFFTFKC